MTALFVCKNKDRTVVHLDEFNIIYMYGQAHEAHNQLCLLIQLDCCCMKISSTKNASASALAVF